MVICIVINQLSVKKLLAIHNIFKVVRQFTSMKYKGTLGHLGLFVFERSSKNNNNNNNNNHNNTLPLHRRVYNRL